MKINFWGADIMRFQELRNRDVMLILGAFEIIFYQDQRILRAKLNAIVAPVGSSLFQG